MISGLDPQMHWQILVVLSFEMFLPGVLNEKHMSLPLALLQIMGPQLKGCSELPLEYRAKR
jgi:hypothetical protein